MTAGGAVIGTTSLADIRTQIRAEESRRSERLRAECKEAHRVIGAIVAMLGGTARIPEELMLCESPELESWMEPDKSCRVLRIVGGEKP